MKKITKNLHKEVNAYNTLFMVNLELNVNWSQMNGKQW